MLLKDVVFILVFVGVGVVEIDVVLSCVGVVERQEGGKDVESARRVV